MISFRQQGDFHKTANYLNRLKEATYKETLKKYGEMGVAALGDATPKDTGLTADSWYYEIVDKSGSVTISFHNSNIQNGVPIAIILQYGHGTRNGGYVEGVDYINPAIQPVFDEIAASAWQEVTRA